MAVLLLFLVNPSQAAEWQWSVPESNSRAYLWAPPDCQRIRAIVLANHNMIEQGVLEHPTMRKALSDLGIAEVWVVPGLDIKFDPAGDAGKRFQDLMDRLADVSGYEELKLVPVVTFGHSANATWPWNFAAWNPGRTLAVLSIHGDAPETNLPGFGGKNCGWGNRNIDGVPGLMVMGEYEWWEDRLTPMFAFKQKYPKAALALLADAGHGHFDYSDELVSFLAMFIRKAAQTRLPELSPPGKPAELKAVEPEKGWRIDRWRKDKSPVALAAPYAEYKGDTNTAFWCFDEEMAKATEEYYVVARGKKPQLLSVTNDRMDLEQGCGEPVAPRFIPIEDGMSFKLKAAFVDVVPDRGNAARWADMPVGSALGHATGGGPIVLSRIVGPVEKVDENTFRLHFGRAEYTQDRRNNDMWLLASHPGDRQYKSAVQQLMVRAVPNKDGKLQTITFPELCDVKDGTKTVKLSATSDAGLPVQYYILEGPAEIDGDALKITDIPLRSKFPIKVTVVAWQWGFSGKDGVQTAVPVERTFKIVK